MKNIKNTLVATGLAAVMMVGATVAQAGMLLSDRTAPATKECTPKTTGGIIRELAGIIIVDGINGMLLSDGMILSDAPCQGNGIIVSDVNGMLLSD